jgi:hypothetical protein
MLAECKDELNDEQKEEIANILATKWSLNEE